MLYHKKRPPVQAALFSPPVGINGAASVTTPAASGPLAGFFWHVNADINNKRIREGHIVSNDGLRGVVASVGNGVVLVNVRPGRYLPVVWPCHSVRVVA